MPVAAARPHHRTMAAARAKRAENVAARHAAKAAGRSLLAPPTKLTTDAAVELYRFEKAARLQRLEAPMAAAKVSFARVLADLEQHGKGGRPKRKHGPGIHVPSGAFPR